jgi:phosphatidylglycerophosphate synthase
MTMTRLVLSPLLVAAVIIRSDTLVILVTGLYVLADVGDGMLARRAGEETGRRRQIDALVDRFTIHSAYLALAVVSGAVSIVWIGLIAKDLIQLPLAQRARARGYIASGGGAHKLVGVLAASVGAALASGAPVPTAFLVLMSAGMLMAGLAYDISLWKTLHLGAKWRPS